MEKKISKQKNFNPWILLNQTRTEKQMRAAALRHMIYFFYLIMVILDTRYNTFTSLMHIHIIIIYTILQTAKLPNSKPLPEAGVIFNRIFTKNHAFDAFVIFGDKWYNYNTFVHWIIVSQVFSTRCATSMNFEIYF